LGIVKYILTFAFLASTGFQPIQDYETISWKSSERLSWSDFKGKIPIGARAAATTASGITYRYSATGNRNDFEVKFKIDTHFFPNKSWYNPALCDAVILSHEQLHFDISELFARKMRKRLNETSFSDNVKAEIRSIYKETLKELSDFQDRYDWETSFSRNREQQLRWNAQIAEALKNTN